MLVYKNKLIRRSALIWELNAFFYSKTKIGKYWLEFDPSLIRQYWRIKLGSILIRRFVNIMQRHYYVIKSCKFGLIHFSLRVKSQIKLESTDSRLFFMWIPKFWSADQIWSRILWSQIRADIDQFWFSFLNTSIRHRFPV